MYLLLAVFPNTEIILQGSDRDIVVVLPANKHQPERHQWEFRALWEVK
jgi:hypothetical protein